jgi:hypothetical protein
VEIPPARASQLAGIFADEGFEVSWEGPLEKVPEVPEPRSSRSRTGLV